MSRFKTPHHQVIHYIAHRALDIHQYSGSQVDGGAPGATCSGECVLFIGTRFSNGRGDEGDDSTNHNETTTGLFSEQTMFRIPSTNYELAT